ncbi:MAG: ATP synthase F0 subunit B [Lachnospiraceae bacterium]|nr:ATP synthase F0 subunit B [Lachnospiraceae bacterium]
MTRIEQGIEDIEDYLASCKGTVFTGSNRVLVERDKMEELLAELRNRIPDEIKKYQKIVASKESILAEAREQADQIVARAKDQAAQISSEHEIMLQAEEKANAMIDQAERQAREAVDSANIQHNEICAGAIDYADKMLASMLTVIRNAMDGADANFAAYMNNMRANYDIVESNLKELRGSDSEPAPAQTGGYRGTNSSSNTGYGYGKKAETSRIPGGSASDNYFGRDSVGHFEEDVPEEEYYEAEEEVYEEEEEQPVNPRSIYATPEAPAEPFSYDHYEDDQPEEEYEDDEVEEEYPEDEYVAAEAEEEYAEADEEYAEEEAEADPEDISEEDRLEEEFARPEPKETTGYRPTYEERTAPVKKEPAAPEIYGESKGSRSGSGRGGNSRRGKRR